MEGTLTVEVLDGVARVDAAAWDALVGEESPFLEHAFLAGLEATGCVGEEAGWIPCPVVVWETRAGVRTLVGAAPAYVKLHSFGEFVYDWRLAAWSEQRGLPWYPKVVAAVPFTPVTGMRLLVRAGGGDAAWVANVRTALLRGLERAGEGLASVNVLFPPEGEVPPGWAERVQHQYHWTNAGYADMEAWLATLPGKRRNAVRRERREVAALVDITVVDGGYPGLAGHLADFYARTCERYTGERGYLTPGFFEHLCARWSHRVHAVLALREGRVIAGTFNVHKGERLYGRYWGAREEVPFLHFEVAIYRAVEWCIANGVRVFEPGHGGEHKHARGFAPTLVRSLHRHAHPGVQRAMADFYARERDAVVAALSGS
jgi:predicted N-acyltransferase